MIGRQWLFCLCPLFLHLASRFTLVFTLIFRCCPCGHTWLLFSPLFPILALGPHSHTCSSFSLLALVLTLGPCSHTWTLFSHLALVFGSWSSVRNLTRMAFTRSMSLRFRNSTPWWISGRFIDFMSFDFYFCLFSPSSGHFPFSEESEFELMSHWFDSVD